MVKKIILALDQGTTSSRAILFDRAGEVLGIAQQEFSQIFPQPGWVEHNASEIWQTQLGVARKVLSENGIQASQIAAIGITNQRETVVVWERKTGKPIANAIVWQDRRTAGMCERLREDAHTAAQVQGKTGLVLDAYFSATKIKWLLDNVAGARQKAERGELVCGTIDSWLVFNLCGAHVTDVSNAARTMLFDIHTLQWDDQLLQLFDIPKAMLPEVVASSGVVGQTHASLFGAAIPVAGIAGDQQAATFGQACHRPGMAKNTYGTGCFMLMNTGSQIIASHNNLLTTVGWKIDTVTPSQVAYMLEGSVFIAGAIIQWLRDGLGMIGSAAEVEALATSVSNTEGVLFVPALVGLGAPYWDPHARGTIVGMTRGTSKAHIARAALESIAYQTAEVLDAMQKDASIVLHELRADGGAARNDFLLQFQADILGVPVIRPMCVETTALGAAYLAGLAVSFWTSLEEIGAQWKMERCFTPQMSADERMARMLEWRRAVERARAWAQ